jgi:hypothetical protein
MTTDTTIQVFGVKEALKELRELDPQLRKDLNKKAKEVVKPATDAIKNAYPNKYLSGMSRSWTQRGNKKFPYDRAAAQKAVGLKIDTGKRNQGTIVIIQKDPAASIIDMAGKAGGQSPQGARFVDAITAQFGPPSRVMWPTYERNADAVERNMVDLVEELMDTIGKRLVM